MPLRAQRGVQRRRLQVAVVNVLCSSSSNGVELFWLCCARFGLSEVSRVRLACESRTLPCASCVYNFFCSSLAGQFLVRTGKHFLDNWQILLSVHPRRQSYDETTKTNKLALEEELGDHLSIFCSPRLFGSLAWTIPSGGPDGLARRAPCGQRHVAGREKRALGVDWLLAGGRSWRWLCVKHRSMTELEAIFLSQRARRLFSHLCGRTLCLCPPPFCVGTLFVVA